jgi:N utilization substance protein A
MTKKSKSVTKKSRPDLKAFFDYIQDISAEKGLSRDEVLEIVKGSLITAYQKKYGLEANLEAILDRETPEIAVKIAFRVVESVQDPSQEIDLAGAREIQSDANIGDTVVKTEDPFEFSRIGATNVRQILLQRLKELEREIIYNEFKSKEGELISGNFLRWRDRDIIYVDLGKVEGILPRREQIPNEKFRTGDRVKAVVKTVELRREKSREPGPFIILSRASGMFVQRLFEMEIPEIYDGVVEILGIARSAGYRTKILVRSNRSDVDPVGACVGIKGVRIQSIVRELGNERIDIVNYSEQAAELIANALSPAKVTEVRVEPNKREALVLVPDDSYSLAIGNNGQNVRLASQLTDYKILVKSHSQFDTEMSSQEARAQLEKIFSAPPQVAEEGVQEGEEDYTPISDLPGISSRIVEILQASGIKSVEDLIEIDIEDLQKIPGIGVTTAKQIMKIISESVEYEE